MNTAEYLIQEYSKRQKPISSHEIAKALDISRTTVIRHLKGDPKIKSYCVKRDNLVHRVFVPIA